MDECKQSIGGMILKSENKAHREKIVPALLWPAQIPHDLPGIKTKLPDSA
jgi:hypothetical protein